MCVKCKFLDIFFSDTSQHVNVFPYSVFYVFYEQYLTMVEDTAISLSISLGAVFIVTFALGGLDIKTAIVTSFTIILILVRERPLMTFEVFWPFLTYLPTFSYP